MANHASPSLSSKSFFPSLRRRPTNSSVRSGTSMFSRMSKNTEERRKGEVIVFDPLEQELWIQDKLKLKGSETYVRLPIPGNSLEVSVYMEQPLPRYANNTTSATKLKGSSEAGTYKVFVADVNLGKMGDWVKHQRRKNKMQYIYVLGQNVIGFPPVAEGEEDDDE